jgi:uncharacterized repeat protein (TIGR01451 family)
LPRTTRQPLAAALGALLLAVALFAVVAPTALGAPAPFALRYSANAPGDIAIVGNTVLTCPATSGACAGVQGGAVGQNNSFGMRFVDVDADPATFNSSSAQLDLPAGATVLFAGLYWGGRTAAGGAPGAAGAPNTGAIATVGMAAPGGAISPVAGAVVGTTTDNGANYQAFADVTARVQAGGAGSYAVSNVQVGRGTNTWGGWSLVVAYRDPAAPLRNLSVFDGYQFVSRTNPSVTIPVSGFLAPPSGPVRARLGVVAYDGDRGAPGSQFVGDSMTLNGTTVSDALNPADDVFNSSITRTGTRLTAKAPDYDNQLGFDADIFSVDGLVPNSATSASIALTTGGESYNPGVVTTAFDLFAPTLASQKTVSDLDGGQVEPGDVLEYGVSLTNTGLDAATAVRLTDPIPAGTTYEPGSLAILSGPGAGPATDPAGDDLAEGGPGGVVFRLGAGASATAGGRLDVGASTSVRFRVRVAASTPAGTVIPNAATTGFTGATSGTPFTDTTAPVSVTVVGTPVLSAAKTATLAVDADGSGGTSAGDTLAYSVVVTNSGNQASTGTVLADSLDPLTRLVVGSVTTTQGTVTSGNAAGQTALRVELGTLAPGASATVAFRARVIDLPPGTTQIRNQAVVSATGLPPVATDDPVTVTPGDPTTVAVTDTPTGTRLGIDLRGPAVSRANRPVTYCATVTNRGGVTARTVTTRVPIPAGTTLVSVPRGARLSGGALTWTTPTLARGARRTVCFTVRLLGVNNTVRRPVATAVATNADRVDDAVRTRLIARPQRNQPAVTG